MMLVTILRSLTMLKVKLLFFLHGQWQYTCLAVAKSHADSFFLYKSITLEREH